MKKIIYTLALLGLTAQSKAADLTVQENGPVGTYGSITSAISASSNGDRIIIHPKIGQNAWVENISISKSLELVSSEDTVRYKIQGAITVLASTGREVTIASAEIIGGDILGSGTGFITEVNILGCVLTAGDINFTNQFNLQVISNVLINGDIRIAKGSIVGNDIQNFNRIVILGADVSDTIQIIANKVSSVFCNTFTFLVVKNNYIKTTNSGNNQDGILYQVSGFSADNKLLIENNTIFSPEGNNSSSSSSANTFLDLDGKAIIKNNIFVEIPNSGNIGPYFKPASGSSISNNYVYQANVINAGVEQLTNYPVNADGRLILPTPAQNGADPSFIYYDLDLTRGDAGCYGGSYSLDNYFPITGSSRVFSVDMPFGLTTGGTLNIKAEGFDR